jgi:hypothetical protein
MADIDTSAEDLISELEAAAREIVPFDAAEFSAEVRDELAAYREQELLPLTREREGGRERFGRGKPGILVPERYRPRAEVFVVFETFVRSFVDPIMVAAEIPDLLANVDRDQQVTGLAFRRFGEEQATAVRPPEPKVLFEDASQLMAMAGNLGRALFGSNFRDEDFWVGRQ